MVIFNFPLRFSLFSQCDLRRLIGGTRMAGGFFPTCGLWTFATKNLKMGNCFSHGKKKKAKRFRSHGGSVKPHNETVTSLPVQVTAPKEMINGAGPSDPKPPSPNLRPSEVGKTSQSLVSSSLEHPQNPNQVGVLSYEASNILWSTGSFSDPIPSGFYSVIPVGRLKLVKSIPTLEQINALGLKAAADVICVDFEKDKELFIIRDYALELVKGLSLSPRGVIKIIASLVADVYEGNTLKSPARTTQSFESHGFQLLGQIKHGSCRARAIFFKVLADAVGIESKLVVGFPGGRTFSESGFPGNHMSVVVELECGERLVDLVRNPGQLIHFSPKAVFIVHILLRGWLNNDCAPPLGPPSVLHSGSRSSSDGASGGRKRHMKTPEISDDTARAARVMKQGCFFKERGDDVSGFLLESHYQPSDRMREVIRLLSLPEINQIQSSERSEPSLQELSQMWNEVLESPKFKNNPLLPYEHWNINFSELTVGTPVRSESSGVVCRGIWDSTDVSIKMLLGKQLTAENMKVFRNEISILSHVRHPNVIMLLGACTRPPVLALVTECMKRGSLYDILHIKQKELSWKRKLKFLHDICCGLWHVHEQGILHCNLSSVNCLLSEKETIKICDFGLSRETKRPTLKATEAVGNPRWMAPELIRNEPISEKCDIFSLGVIMWELSTLIKPWDGFQNEDVIHMVANEGVRLPTPAGPLSELIADCLSEPKQRPSCKEIMDRLKICESLVC